MKLFITISLLLMATYANSQEIASPSQDSKFDLVPAVKTTATTSTGESYVITRNEENKIVFVKTNEKDFAVRPILINLEPPTSSEKNP